MSRLLVFALATAALSATASAQIIKARFDAVGSIPAVPSGISNHFGNDVVQLGDIDGDGLTDYAVADAAYHVNVLLGFSTNGAVHLFSGTGVPAPRITSLFGSSLDHFGSSLAVVGDVTGDGIGELAVGAHQGGAGAGYVRCYDPVTGFLLFQANGPAPGSWFGHGVASINDLDTPPDGARDVLVMGFDFVQVRSSANGALLYQAPTSATLNSGITHPGAVAVLDLDADGFEDFVVGSPRTFSIDGYSGNPAPVFGGLLAQVNGFASEYGFAVATTGDVDGDGIGDFAVGAPGVGANFVDVYTGRASGFGFPLIRQIQGPAMSGFGTSVSGLGAGPGGPLSDLLVGAIGSGPGTPAPTGAATAIGGSTGATLFPVNPPAPLWGYGNRVLDGGPGSGSPYHEMIVSYSPSFSSALGGNVWVFHGAPPVATAARGAGCGPAGPGILAPLGAPTLGNGAFNLIHSSPTVGGSGVMYVGVPSPAIPVLPGCSLFFDPVSGVPLPFVVAGLSFIPLPIPALPSLAGGMLTTQAIVGTTGGSFQLSNGLDLTLGY